jgi:hypothetical protein
MSALGQFLGSRTCAVQLGMSAMGPKADIRRRKQKDRLHNGPSETRSDVLTPERQAPCFPSVDNNRR